MDIKELRDCTAERLSELEKTLRKDIFDARIKNFTNQLDDTASIRRARRDLARVLTVQSERAIVDMPAGSDSPPDSTAPDSGEAGADSETQEGTEE